MAEYDELVKDLREEADWAEGNEWETPIMLSDHLNTSTPSGFNTRIHSSKPLRIIGFQSPSREPYSLRIQDD